MSLKKKIAIDISYYWKLSWYWIVTNNLLKNILEKDKKNYFYLISNENKNLSEIKHLKNWEFICTNTSFVLHKFFKLTKYLKKYWIDLYFSFDQDIPLKKVCKYAIVCHDIWAYIYWKKDTLINLLKKKISLLVWIYYLLGIDKKSAKKSDLIFCPSQNTKNDLIKYYWIDKNKIIVSYWWLDHLKTNSTWKINDYILFPFSNLYDDFQYELANKLIEEKIINKIVFLKPACLNNDNILKNGIKIIRNRISESELANYYSNAKLSIYLTSYDGFWFPPLESIFYWTPVLCNNAPCIPEILDWLWIIGELNENNFIATIKKYLNDKKSYESLLVKQKNRIKIFNRNNTATIILDNLWKC